MNITKSLMAILSGVALLLSSCSTPKDVTYLQGMENGQSQAVRPERRITIEPDDRISIIVNAKDPKLAEVFNLPIYQGRIGQGGNSSYQTADYTVSPDGFINFPVLGKLHIAGMTRTEVAPMIEKQLVEREQLKSPVVSVNFQNAKVAVLGDVARPGEYEIDRDNMTILQAISKAGDLNITGVRTNVLVVREDNGQNVAYRLDLTKTDQLMQSPAYYVQQNDVIYIDPNDTKKRQATSTGNTVLSPSFWISVASLLTTVTALIIR